MKILHLSKMSYCVSSLVSAQKQLGFDVELAFLDMQNNTVTEIEGRDFIHIHDLQSLALFKELIKEPLAKFTNSTKLYFHDWDAIDKLENKFFQEFLPYFEKILWSNPTSEKYYQGANNAQYVPAFLNFSEFVMDNANRMETPELLKAIFIPELNPNISLNFINEIKDKINKNAQKLEIKILTLKELHNISKLEQEFNSSHILIENLEACAYGEIGILGMSYGLTVLSGATFPEAPRWDPLRFCAVLHTSQQNLENRLKSIVLEPRCLRDFAKRSRKFAQNEHSASKYIHILKNLYAKNANNNLNVGTSLSL